MNTQKNGTFVRATSIGAALYAAASRPGNNHPVKFSVKRLLAVDERPYSVLERSQSPRKK